MLQLASFGKFIQNKISKVMASAQDPISQLPLNMQFYESDRYQPSIEDVLTVKDVFLSLLPETPLPLELIDAIIDLAEYWPHTSTTLPPDRRETYVRAGGDDENRFMLRSLPIGFTDYKT